MQPQKSLKKKVDAAQAGLDSALRAASEVTRVTGHSLDVTLRPKETARIAGCSLSTLWRWVRAGTFPPPFKLSPDGDAVGFSGREVAEAQAERKRDRVWTGEVAGKLGKPKSEDDPTPEATP